MTELVKWDYTYNAPLESMPDDKFPGMTHRVTSEVEQPDSEVAWVEVVPEYPEDYLPDFPELLGPAKYSLGEDGKIHKVFLYSDYSVESVRLIIEDRIEETLRESLSYTDFYVLRRVELGEEIPPPVVESRANARQEAQDYIEAARTAPAQVLPQLRWNITTTQPVRKWQAQVIDESGGEVV